MDRRSFGRSLLGGAVALQQLDIEKLLWLPRERTIFIPPQHQWNPAEVMERALVGLTLYDRMPRFYVSQRTADFLAEMFGMLPSDPHFVVVQPFSDEALITMADR